MLVLPSEGILPDFVVGFAIRVATGDNTLLSLFVMFLCGGIAMPMHLVSGTTESTELGRHR